MQVAMNLQIQTLLISLSGKFQETFMVDHHTETQRVVPADVIMNKQH